jgi:DNA polymerase-3 subunit epsilon
VYYFYNAAGKAIYVGKAINLLKRVKSHFANNNSSRQKQDFLRDIHRISYHPTATDLMAHILESIEIRKLWPIYNRSQRGYHPKFALYAYEDQQGYTRLALDAYKQHVKPLHTFNTIFEGHQWLRRLIREFELCARLCNLAKGADCENGNYAEGCTGQCHNPNGPEEYNSRVLDAISWISRSLPTIALLDHGRTDGEQSCILIEGGAFKGMGYLSTELDIVDIQTFRQAIEPMPDNDYIRNLVYKHASDFPDKCIRWEGGVMQKGLSSTAFHLHVPFEEGVDVIYED